MCVSKGGYNILLSLGDQQRWNQAHFEYYVKKQKLLVQGQKLSLSPKINIRIFLDLFAEDIDTKVWMKVSQDLVWDEQLNQGKFYENYKGYHDVR